MRFSQYFGLKNLKQENFQFIDIRIDWDNELFIDPTLIEAQGGSLAKECDEIVSSFFNTILDLYQNKDIEEARKSLIYSGESNEIFFGYTQGFPRGSGTSETELNEIFNYLHQEDLIHKGIIGRVEDLHVFIEDFGCDKMSDLIASLLKKKLVEFTIEQCEIYNIPRHYKLEKKYWDSFGKSWKDFSEYVPAIKNNKGKAFPVVLIPKFFCVDKYLYDSDKYWEKIVSGRRQDYHRANNTPLYLNEANKQGELNKKDILSYEKEGRSLKEYLIDYTENDLEAIQNFRERIKNTQRSNERNILSDEEITQIIDKSYEKN